MKKSIKISKKVAILTLFCAIILCVFVGISFRRDALNGNAATPVSSVSVNTSYEFGTTLKIPSDVKIEYEGKTYEAESYVLYPNGDVRKGTSFLLDRYGKYSLISQANTEQGLVSANQDFEVVSEYYSVGTEKSSFTYGELGFGSTKGLQIKLAEGDTFYFHDPIDIYENTWTDLVTFSILQDETTKVKFLTFRLTDCYDSSNYIELTFKRYDYFYENYIVASANGGRAAGFINPKGIDKGELSDPTQLKVSANGTGVDGNYYSKEYGRPVYVPIRYSLDTTDKKNIKCYVTVVGYESQNVLIAEFNNDKIFDYPFEGFKNGKVFLSVKASSLIAVDTAEVHISSVAGIGSGKDFLANSKYEDKSAPLIVVDSPLEKANIVAGCALRIPAATAYDESGLHGDVSYTVWYNYGKANAYMVPVTDGTFVPRAKGIYSVVYRASDVFGNMAEKVLTLHAVKSADTGIVFACTEQTQTEAGAEVSLNRYTVDSLSGGASVSVTLVYPDGTEYVSEDTERTFLLDLVGEYTVTYRYNDYYYEGSYSYTFTTTESSAPVFAGEFVLPEYFIKGATYSVDGVKAYMYTASGANEVETVKEISFDGGEFTSFDEKEFTVTGNDKLQLRYTCKENGEVSCFSEEIDIIDVDYDNDIQKDKYFVGEGFTSAIDNKMSYYTATTDGDKCLKFINPILLSAFDFQFEVDPSVTGVTLVLTDYYNRNNRFEIIFSGEKLVSMNGGTSDVLASSWKGNKISVIYDDGRFVVGSNSITLSRVPDFEYCLFSIELTGIHTDAKFCVYKLQNQLFNDIISMDRVTPIISSELPEKVCALNETILFNRAYCSDVLSPSSINSCKLTVMNPNGKPVLDRVDASTNTHTVTLTEYGEYYAYYEYEDGAGNVGYLEYYIYVFDFVAPTIQLVNYTGIIDVALNQELTPIEYSATDDITKAEDLTVYCLVYDDRGVWISSRNNDGQSFVLREAGIYTVYLYCIDEAGNTSYVSYEVRAK